MIDAGPPPHISFITSIKETPQLTYNGKIYHKDQKISFYQMPLLLVFPIVVLFQIVVVVMVEIVVRPEEVR